MIAYTLFSGSSGNSIYIKNGKDEILIDAGKSAGAIEKALTSLGTSLRSISAIFLTHEHTDHTSGLEIISKKYQIPIHVTAPSCAKVGYQGSFTSRFTCIHEVLYEQRVGSLTLKSFEIPHFIPCRRAHEVLSSALVRNDAKEKTEVNAEEKTEDIVTGAIQKKTTATRRAKADK